jgi:predicted YcjX-like family ATPase
LGGRFWNTLAKRSWLGRRVEWEFLDFPGERLSDALIAGNGSFSVWSDALLELWDLSDNLRDGMSGFLSLLAGSPAAAGAELIAAYKRSLAGIISGKNQLITPSTFMLGLEPGGGPPTREELASGAAGRCSGLPGGEFAPLSRSFRAARPDLAEEFSRNYLAYRDSVVMPLFRAINDCDTLLLVMDIPGILSGGVGRYNDASHLIESLADNITPSGWFRGHVDKMALVAAKADMVHVRDHDSLKSLADDMLRLARNRRPDLPGGYASFVVSAWVSAESVSLEDGGRALRGVPARGGGGGTRVFRVPELLPDWPGDWKPEDPAYSYPRLSPPPLANRFTAPEQWNLEKIFDFILS